MKLKRFAASTLAAVMAFCSVSVVSVGAADSKLVAFPGAEGGGMYAQGARAGSSLEIYHVTNLNDSGQGSFRDAVSKDNRIIVFDVAGTIMLKSRVSTGHNNLTILGQTAPNEGICIGGENVAFGGNNIIVRYLRFRCGYDSELGYGASGDDALGVRGGHDIIFDHCSISWSVDEALSAYENKNFTAQYCIISESLNASGHPKGNHGYGGIWGGINASFHHNLLASHSNRVPKIGTSATVSSYEGTPNRDSLVDMRNNVIYNWGATEGSYGGEDGIRVNLINNYYKYGPAFNKSGVPDRFYTAYSGNDARNGKIPTYLSTTLYIDGNVMDKNTSITSNNKLGVGKKDDADIVNILDNISDTVNGKKNDEFIGDYPITTQTAQEAYNTVLEEAGASFHRDEIDKRVINNVKNGTAPTESGEGGKNSKGLIDSQNDVGGWDAAKLTTIAEPTYEGDSDHDGISDEFENANGLDPNNDADAKKINENTGYTWIEEYANYLLNPTELVNKSALNAAITKAEAVDKTNYTDETVAALNKALADAKTVQADANATQESVNAAEKALTDAINGLKEKPNTPPAPTVDKTALNAAIASAANITDTTIYTDDSAKTFTDALNSAKTVQADEAAVQAQVDDAKSTLEDARSKLVAAWGDVDNDGKITANDAAAVYAFSATTGNTNWRAARAKVTAGEGAPGAADASEILKKVLRASYVLPVEKK